MAKAKPLGGPDSPDHKKLVRELVDIFDYYDQQRKPIIEQSLQWWDLYRGRKKEFRTKGEEWRANLHSPKPFANTESKVANLVSIMLGSDPLIQPEPVHDSFLQSSASIERLLDYTYRKNEIAKSLTKLLRTRSVVGTVFFKWVWAEEKHEIVIPRDPKMLQGFTEYLDQVRKEYPNVAATIPDPFTDPEGYMKTRELANAAGEGYPKLPEIPTPGPKELVRYRGPRLVQLRTADVYLDPLIDEIRHQHCVIHRAVKPRSWGEEKVERGIFDDKAFEHAVGKWDGKFLEDESQALAQTMGITDAGDKQADPYYELADEYLEFWRLGASYPFAILMNRAAVVNADPTRLPFWHGECAIQAARTVVIPGHFYGLSDLEAPRDQFWEKDRFRSLRLDMALLNTIPAYTMLTETGMPSSLLQIRPNQVIPVRRENAINPLLRQQVPPEAYREPQEMDNEADDAMGVYASTRGREAQIGRVTGTEYQGRENRAQIRLKLDALWFEEDFSPSNRHICAMFAQKSTPKLRLKIGGKPDPFVELRTDELLESLDYNYRFRGPTKAIARDMLVQNLFMWVKDVGGQLLPQEFRFVARYILDLLDVKGADAMVSDAGTAQKTNEYMMATGMQNQQAGVMGQQAGAATAPQPPGQPAAPPAQQAPPQQPPKP